MTPNLISAIFLQQHGLIKLDAITVMNVWACWIIYYHLEICENFSNLSLHIRCKFYPILITIFFYVENCMPCVFGSIFDLVNTKRSEFVSVNVMKGLCRSMYYLSTHVFYNFYGDISLLESFLLDLLVIHNTLFNVIHVDT